LTRTFDIAPFVAAESDRITADDLIAGPRTFTIERIEGTMAEGKKRMVVHLADSPGKPFMPCKGMVRLLGQLWGPDAAKWVGRGITLFRDPDVRFGADLTGGVRIAAVTHIDRAQPIAVRASQKKVKSYKVEPLKAPAPAADKAAEWAQKRLEAIGRADTLEKLDALQNASSDGLTRMANDRPDLHKSLTAAFGARRNELTAPFEQAGAAAEEAPDEAAPTDLSDDGEW
jgi:hypothetical protein